MSDSDFGADDCALLEEQVSTIWREALAVEIVGEDDNFFVLGGTSLSAIKVVVGISEKLRVEIPIDVFFNGPTVRQCVAAVAYQSKKSAMSPGSDIDIGVPTDSSRVPMTEDQQEFMAAINLGRIKLDSAHLRTMVRLQGPFNSTALESGLRKVLSRHEALRFHVETEGAEQFLVAYPAANMPFSVKHSTYDDIDAALISLNAEVWRPFDLESGPLIRVVLGKITDLDFVLLIAVHHLIIDAWAMDLLREEICSAYNAALRDSAMDSDLPPLQFSEYIRARRLWNSTEAGHSQIDWWKELLAKLPPPLQLPVDKSAPSAPSGIGKQEAVVFSAEFTAALQAAAARCQVTLFMLLLTAYHIVLARWTDNYDVASNAVTMGRSQAGLDRMIGCVARMLVLNIPLRKSMSFREALAQVRKICIETYAIEASAASPHIPAELKGAVIRRTGFQLLNRAPAWSFDGVVATDCEITTPDEEQIIPQGFYLELQQEPDGISGWLKYNGHMFESKTIRRFLAEFHELLVDVINDPDMAITADNPRVDSVSDIFKQEALPALIHDRFVARAEETPAAVALRFGDVSLTYGELNIKTNQLAHYLQHNGVQRNSIVGVYMKRSIEMVVAIIGILKAGGAYLPIDTDSPAARVNEILEDAELSLILTHQPASLQASGSKCLFLDRDWAAEIAPFSELPATNDTAEDDIAYVLYTSGSTGKPKAVLYPHRGINALFRWMIPGLSIGAKDVFLLKTSYTFDISTYEILLPLEVGARIVIAADGGSKDVFYLHNIINSEKVSIVNFAPQMLKLFSMERLRDKLSSLRLVIISGEALRQSIVNTVAKNMPWCELYNLYGLTEVQSITAYKCNTHDTDHIVCLGETIADAELYVLDEHMAPVANGIPGELYVGGVTVAKGYLNQVELTKARFLRDPFRNSPDALIYKTGDQVIRLDNGNFRYLGRLDSQVKINGVRVELGEVEGHLLKHELVRDTAVLAVNRQDGEAYLVAYVILDTELRKDSARDNALAVAELREYMNKTVPQYMVPSRFLCLEQLPLNQNGKVDKKSLASIHAG